MPLSIVIVGVGNADFESMDVLDADEEPLYSKKYKKYMSRDIVQFVPFRDFKNDPYKLAKETLTEIPGQLVSFLLGRLNKHVSVSQMLGAPTKSQGGVLLFLFCF